MSNQRAIHLQTLQNAYQESESARARAENALQESRQEKEAVSEALGRELQIHGKTEETVQKQWQILQRLSSLMEAMQADNNISSQYDEALATVTKLQNRVSQLEKDLGDRETELQQRTERVQCLETEWRKLQDFDSHTRTKRHSLRRRSIANTESSYANGELEGVKREPGRP